MFYNIDTCGQCYDTFFSVTYATMSLIPYDFNQGYADSDKNYAENFYNIAHVAKCYETFYPALTLRSN